MASCKGCCLGLLLFWDVFCEERLKNLGKSRIIILSKQTEDWFVLTVAIQWAILWC